jgi:dUTP pyrophosphatase
MIEQHLDGYECPKIPTFQFALSEGLGDEFLPTKGSERATGWDVRANGDQIIYMGMYAKISLGFRVFTPEGWWLKLSPRSSSFTKKSLHALYGVIDEDYGGQMIFACQYLPEAIGSQQMLDIFNYPKLEIKHGEAIGQLIPVRREEMKVRKVSNEEIENLYRERGSKRGSGGFGSTDGRK